MDLQLTNGVRAHIQTTSKFKTVLIEYKFRTKYEPEIATKRTLLKNIMVTNSKKYPSQKALDNQMSWLYGASLSASTQRYGTEHVLSFRLKVINDRFIGGYDNLLEEGFAFLQEVIFNPNIEDAAFHQPTFDREKINLENYFNSLEDDKGRFATIKLNEALFEGTDQAYLGMGSETFLPNISSQSLYTTYQEMIADNAIDIYVSGDVDSERIEKAIKQQPLVTRAVASNNKFVTLTPRSEAIHIDYISDVSQGKLLFGFKSPAYYGEAEYYTGMVFNGLFGGFPHSKLFQNVREKESLAYSASSYLDYIRGVMIVSTGIAFEKKDQAEAIVLEQLADMQKGDFEDYLIAQTKDMLVNQYKQNDDNQSAALSKIYSNNLLAGRTISDEEWLSGIEHVKREDIIKLANQMALQIIFFLKGEDDKDA